MDEGGNKTWFEVLQYAVDKLPFILERVVGPADRVVVFVAVGCIGAAEDFVLIHKLRTSRLFIIILLEGQI